MMRTHCHLIAFNVNDFAFIGNEFRNAIDYINCHVDDAHKILYCALDYSHISKHRNLNGELTLYCISSFWYWLFYE